MRQIKFRAWDKEENKMFEWDYVKLKMEMFLYSGIFIPMQFTGLVDRNGTEIFESDVVEMRFNAVDEHPIIERGEIKWNEIDAGFCWVSDSDDNEKGWRLQLVDEIYRKVIGNIYEHPDLLIKKP